MLEREQKAAFILRGPFFKEIDTREVQLSRIVRHREYYGIALKKRARYTSKLILCASGGFLLFHKLRHFTTHFQDISPFCQRRHIKPPNSRRESFAR